jgi:3-deoxy-D-manno-octulosonic-acid transferase
MLEAAAAGCCTVVGWDCKAQPDPMAILRAAEAVVELVPGQVAPVLAALAADRARRSDLGHRAQLAWAAGRGAMERLDRHLAEAFARCGLAPGDPP